MTPELAKEIQAEQDHGRQKYGSGPNDFAHDDAHYHGDWHDYIDGHNGNARSTTGMERRQYLIKVAGLAVSAIESFDRKRAELKAEEQCKCGEAVKGKE